LASTHGRWRRCCRFPYRWIPARPKPDPFVGIIERILEEDSLQDAATADALRAVCDLELTDLQAIDPPRGFGRD